MLSGVLVVAFPVSVFSDLWSEELKEVKGFNDLFENNADDENDEAANQQAAGLNVSSSPRTRPSSNSNTDDVEFLSHNPAYVVMEKADLNEIVASLRTIRQEQQHIKRLLKKYYVVKED